MSQVDQFESVFRAAIKPVYEPHAIQIRRATLVSDGTDTESAALESGLTRYLQSLHCPQSGIQWTRLQNQAHETTADLLAAVEASQPDLICSYRNLGTEDWRFRNSIGSRLDTLVHQSPVPVLIIPHPKSEHAADHALQHSATVVAVTDHLTEEHTLVDYAQTFTEPNGTLFLVHLEDALVFERYLEAIGKIDTIDTDLARQTLHDQLLADPRAYFQSCRDRLKESDPSITVSEVIEFAPGLDRLQALIPEHHADLIVVRGPTGARAPIHAFVPSLINDIREIPILAL